MNNYCFVFALSFPFSYLHSPPKKTMRLWQNRVGGDPNLVIKTRPLNAATSATNHTCGRNQLQRRMVQTVNRQPGCCCEHVTVFFLILVKINVAWAFFKMPKFPQFVFARIDFRLGTSGIFPKNLNSFQLNDIYPTPCPQHHTSTGSQTSYRWESKMVINRLRFGRTEKRAIPK